jgi:pimeloyl-ACP methyl ester carboxylesterase
MNKTGPASPKPTKTKAKNSHWRGSDVLGATKLATQATVNISHIVEEVHQSVLGTIGFKGKAPKNTASGGLTGLVYDSVRTITRWVGGAVDLSYALAQPLLDKNQAINMDKAGAKSALAMSEPATSPQREAVLAALNGVIGDLLARQSNPLATKMSLRFKGAAIDLQAGSVPLALGPKVLLIIHGLCMNDLQWGPHDNSPEKPAINHAEILALRLTMSPVYLRYNSGLGIAENGQELARQLAALLLAAPHIQELNVLCHSMGGLIIRSALQQGQAQWPILVKRVVFLGTPHHGAPLERAGRWIDLLLGITPFSAPFKRLTQLRSTGITDLRYGRITKHGQPPDLPSRINFYCIAATTAAQRSLLADRLLGDGLVPLNSALGVHKIKSQTLAIPKANQRIFYKMNHMELLTRGAISEQLVAWFEA